MNDKRPVVIDLFAGAGGLSLGFEQAGFDVVAAAEIDPVHACVHRFNFPDCAVMPRSVADVSGNDLRAIANLDSKTPIDVVVGGAPCQGFSLMGQRALDDPRNVLAKEFIRIVNELRPSYFLFENVKGLTIGAHLNFLQEVLDWFHRIGYDVLQPWQVLNARDYGVPQCRERLFLLGAKRGCPLPSYPAPLPSEHAVTCSDALADLPDAEQFESLLFGDEVMADYSAGANGYSALMRCRQARGWRYGYRRLWDARMLTSSRRTAHTVVSRKRFSQTKPGTREPISRFFRLSADGVSNTLRAGTDAARGAFTSPRPIHYQYARCITVREMARLHGFPDWFRFHATKWHGARQVGNSVPPPLAFAIAREIFKCLPHVLTHPQRPVPLGDTALLNMDMTASSAYWGVKNPIAKRNQKSGRRKRKQSELEALAP